MRPVVIGSAFPMNRVVPGSFAVFALAMLACGGAGPPTEAPPAPPESPTMAAPAPIPVPVYSLLSEEGVPGVKRSLEVRLEAPASEAELTAIAKQLRASDTADYPATFILYYLPGMEPGAGAWATSHFDPELEVHILGLTAADQARLRADAAPANQETLGTWLDQQSSSKIVLYEKCGRVFFEQTWKTSARTVEMTRKHTPAGTRFAERKANSCGEYYIIDKSGRLESFDRDGPNSTADVIE